MPSVKHNLTMGVATGLISSLLDVASSQALPFCQPQDVECMHHQSCSKAKKSGRATCEHVNLTMHPLENFESLTAILAEAINGNCKIINSLLLIGGVVLTVLLECHTDCSIRVSRSFAKFPMAESDPAKTGLAGPLATALMYNLCMSL